MLDIVSVGTRALWGTFHKCLCFGFASTQYYVVIISTILPERSFHVMNFSCYLSKHGFPPYGQELYPKNYVFVAFARQIALTQSEFAWYRLSNASYSLSCFRPCHHFKCLGCMEAVQGLDGAALAAVGGALGARVATLGATAWAGVGVGTFGTFITGVTINETLRCLAVRAQLLLEQE